MGDFVVLELSIRTVSVRKEYWSLEMRVDSGVLMSDDDLQVEYWYFKEAVSGEVPNLSNKQEDVVGKSSKVQNLSFFETGKKMMSTTCFRDKS